MVKKRLTGYNHNMENYFLKRQIDRFALLFSVLAILFLLASCVGGAKAISASGLGKASDPVPFMLNARTGTLPSGLRYYLLENALPEGRAYLTLAVNAGSVLETEEERGLAHFVEHMAFNGTSRFARSELINYLRSLGMRFGPEVNAYTSFDETVYGIEVPVETGPDGRKTIPDMALAVIDDWTANITFDPADVDSERLVILEEYRSRLGAGERVSRELYPVLFRGSRYAERLPIGLPEVIENAPVERLVGYYKKWYRPENMAVIIVGDFDSAFLERELAGHFPDHWGKAEAFNRPRYDLSEPKKGSFEALVITDSELTRSRVDLYWKLKPEVRRMDLAYYRDGVIDYLASTMLSLRFGEETAKSQTPYVYAGAAKIKYGYSSRFYILVAQAKTGATEASLKEMLLAKESLSRYGFTQNETDIAKASLVSTLEQLVAEKDRQPSDSYVSAFTQHFLTAETVPDLEWELDAIKKLLPGITLKEINSRVKGYFSDDDLRIVITAPDSEKESLPSVPEIRTMVAEARKARISPPVSEKVRDELLDRAPRPGSVVSETVDGETGAIRWMLDNGAEVILKETKNRNSEVSLYALARGGTMSAPDEFAVSSFLAAEMLNASGLGQYSRPELAKILLDKQVSLSFSADNYLRGFQGSASAKDLKALFEMLHISFTQPRLEGDAIEAMLDQRRSALTYQENDPNAYFSREIIRTIYGNPRFHPLVLADLDKANRDEAMNFILRCLNPADYTFVFTGNLDIPLLRSLAETYLASIPRSPPFNEWEDVDPLRPPGAAREIFKGREERSTVYMAWFRPEAYSEEKSAAVSVLDEYLDIQLTDEIRQNLGGVYSTSSWVSLSPIPHGELSGGVYFVCDPKRVEELASAVKGEFQKIADGNIDSAVLEKAVEALIMDYGESIQSNYYIAQSYANSAVIYRSPLSRLDKRPALFRAVSPADIQRIAGSLLAGSSARLTLYPE